MQYKAPSIAPQIPDQFPSFYKDDGPFFVEFVKTYYEFLDNNNIRNFFDLRDIDSTIERFVIYYKRKFLTDLPFPDLSNQNIRFLVKHISDLYKRKGTPESLQLLFRMFFQQEVELYYPASSILKISDSKYTFSTFLEFIPVSDIKQFQIKKGDFLFGDTSKASGFVDEVVFYNINGAITPVAYISNVFGKFQSDDGLKVTRNGSVFYPGKLIYGSIKETTVLRAGNRAGNKVGDRLDLVSSQFGTNATAVVEEVSETPSGVVSWNLENGGFGYSTTLANNVKRQSTQVLVLLGDPIDVDPYDVVVADAVPIVTEDPTNPIAAADEGSLLSGTGVVIAYEHPIIYIETLEPDIANPASGAFISRNLNSLGVYEITVFPDAGKSTITINKTTGVSFDAEISTLADYNNSAQWEVGSFVNQEKVMLIVDKIGDFENVQLDSTNYGMSGAGIETINTTLRDAFTPVEYELGTINRVKTIDSGTSYKNNVRVIYTQPDILSFNFGLIGLKFDRSDFLITTDDTLEQVIQVEDLTYASDYVDYTVKGKFVRREGNIFFFQPLSFYQFKKGYPVVFRGATLNIVAITERQENVMGGNAVIEGESEFLVGQIKRIKMLKSGFRYTSGEVVDLVNKETGLTVAKAELFVDGMGQTEGGWVTTTSHLNDANRFIQDNNFYQEYSYNVSSILNPDVYEQVIKDTVHVAGTKLFSSPLINTINDVRPDADVAIEAYDLQPIPLLTEGGDTFVTESGVSVTGIGYAILKHSVGTLGTNGLAPNLAALFDSTAEVLYPVLTENNEALSGIDELMYNGNFDDGALSWGISGVQSAYNDPFGTGKFWGTGYVTHTPLSTTFGFRNNLNAPYEWSVELTKDALVAGEEVTFRCGFDVWSTNQTANDFPGYTFHQLTAADFDGTKKTYSGTFVMPDTVPPLNDIGFRIDMTNAPSGTPWRIDNLSMKRSCPHWLVITAPAEAFATGQKLSSLVDAQYSLDNIVWHDFGDDVQAYSTGFSYDNYIYFQGESLPELTNSQTIYLRKITDTNNDYFPYGAPTNRKWADFNNSGYITAADAVDMIEWSADPTVNTIEDYRCKMLVDHINSNIQNGNTLGIETQFFYNNDISGGYVDYITLWSNATSDVLSAVVVNFGSVDLGFEGEETTNLGVVGSTDFSLDSLDETRVTLDNQNLTFDRT